MICWELLKAPLQLGWGCGGYGGALKQCVIVLRDGPSESVCVRDWL